ncbi:MAG: Cyanophage [Bacteroidota bacterium]|jgi:hypothetical protein
MDKIIFFSSVLGLAETFPIRPAKEVVPKWAYVARQDYIKNKDKKEMHVYKCPGIFDTFGTGYIISAWHDLELETDGLKFRMTIPDNKLNELLEKETVQEQTWNAAITKFIPKPPWAVKSILKINTPWHVIAPKGVKFLMVPLPYPDEFSFQSCIGILDPGVSSELNVQGYWNNNSPGIHTIKAGTPLAQIIPITEKTYDFIVRDMNDQDKKWIEKRKYLNFFGFILNRSKIKEAYERMIK